MEHIQHQQCRNHQDGRFSINCLNFWSSQIPLTERFTTSWVSSQLLHTEKRYFYVISLPQITPSFKRDIFTILCLLPLLCNLALYWTEHTRTYSGKIMALHFFAHSSCPPIITETISTRDAYNKKMVDYHFKFQLLVQKDKSNFTWVCWWH